MPLALKWEDVDFERWQINVRRSIYLNVVGNCKTEASRKPVPLDLTLASELWTCKQDSAYRQPNDWVFASPHSRGRNPYWPDILLSRVVRPAAARAGIRKHIGWHTFRHSFSTMLMANGENVKVVQQRTAASQKVSGGSQPKADPGLLVKLTMPCADRVQPHFCGTSAQAILKNLGWRFCTMAKLVYGLNQSLDGYVDHLKFRPREPLNYSLSFKRK